MRKSRQDGQWMMIVHVKGTPGIVNVGWKYMLLKATNRKDAERERHRWYDRVCAWETSGYAPVDYYSAIKTTIMPVSVFLKYTVKGDSALRSVVEELNADNPEARATVSHAGTSEDTYGAL